MSDERETRDHPGEDASPPGAAHGPSIGGVPSGVPFQAEITRAETEVVVHVRGELDVASGPVLWERLAEAIPDAKRLVLDLKDTNFVDSMGLSVFVRALRRLRADGGDLILRSPTPNTLKVLRMTGLDKVFTIEG
jgi:anti-sigma B factor antagonist